MLQRRWAFVFVLFAALSVRIFPEPGSAGDDFTDRARSIAAKLDDSSLAAQVILTGIDGKGALTKDMAAILRAVPAGGVLLFSYNLDIPENRIAPFLAGVKDLIKKGCGIAPLAALDQEGGSVERIKGAASLPSAASYWKLAQGLGQAAALKAVERDAAKSASILHSLGLTLNLAPVAETLSPGNQAFLSDRSYGPDPQFSGDAAAAFIQGMQEGGIACAAKHFPGDAGADPHKGRSSLPGDKAALESQIHSFKILLEKAPPAAIMVSHAFVPAWDPKRNASRSPAIIRDWLRKDLGFKGIILADDFSMKGALTGAGLSPEEAAVEALAAGVDMIIAWPPSLRRSHRAILRALKQGRLPRSRLREASARIIALKLRLGQL